MQIIHCKSFLVLYIYLYSYVFVFNNKQRCPNEAPTKHENNCTLHQYRVLNTEGKSANNSSSAFHKQVEESSK